MDTMQGPQSKRRCIAASIFRVLAIALAVLVTGAAAAEREAQLSDVVGTWRFYSVNGHRWPQPFYVRIYANGKAATWPAPKDWNSETVHGVSHGGFLVKGGYLIWAGADIRAKIAVKGDKFFLETEDGDHLVYRRVIPDLEPGKIGTP
jgi:hypothetical protein